jgi:ATP-dependent Clp protease ATP-binding subunit ClpC
MLTAAMSKRPRETRLELRTALFVRELAEGGELCFPLADPSLVSYGDEEGDAVSEQRVFLEDYLREQRPETLASFAVPDGTRLEEIDVLLEREDLPRQLQPRAPITLACVVIPHGRDRWVVCPAVRHTFHLAPDEELRAAVTDEVRRMVAAREADPFEFARLLPPQAHRLEQVTLTIDRTDRFLPARARELRRMVEERKRRADAVEILESVGRALHRSDRFLAGPPLAGRARELADLAALLDGKERLSVLLVGEPQVGKSALVQGWLRRQRPGGGTPRRPVYGLSASQLIAGMSGLGQWQERVQRVMRAAEELDAVLYLDNLGELLGDRPEGRVDLAGAIRPFLDENKLRLLGEIHPEVLDRQEQRHLGFLSCLHRLQLRTLDASHSTEVVRERIAWCAKHAPHRPNLAQEAVPTLIDLCDRYLPYQAHPGKAVRLFDELRALHEGRGANDPAGPPVLGERELLEAFSLQTGVPLFLLRQDQPLKLESLTASLRRRLIGQEAAVARVAETICVVKARLQPPDKPLATFLFIGPTGVGKTELARSLAATLFGDEGRLTRFDMSEYMDPLAAERLIRGSDRAEGMLTRRVRQQPFCVLLLDEIEKAHPAVFDLLLQVCGEGRLTDAAGRTAHFQNALIIMTSNLGAAGRRAPIGLAAGAASAAEADEAYYQEQVNRSFRPELVNRIDRIVAFHPLGEAQIAEVTRLQLERLATRRGLAELGIGLTVEPSALTHLAAGGYSVRYGARALRRHLEDALVAPLAARLAELGERARGARAVVTVADAARGEGELLAESREGELRIQLLRGAGALRKREAGSVSVVAALRRNVDRFLRLPTASEVKEQIELAVTQLSARGSRRRKQETRSAQEIVELQSEHARLSELWTRATTRQRELVDLEELALTALLSEEDPSSFLDEAGRSYSGFLSALYLLLVAQRRRRDAVTLIVEELDDERALDRWLGGLLRDLERRRWTLRAHQDGARGEDWPAERRWGPPRDASWVAAELALARRPFRSLLLRVTGPYANAALGLERGLHRTLSSDGTRPALLHVRHLAERSELTELEWKSERILPNGPAQQPQLRRLPPQRAYDDAGGPCRLLGGERSADVPLAEYWPRHAEVAVQVLLAYEEPGNRTIDQLYAPELLGGGPAAKGAT